ncbi:MAG: peptidase M15, partial [Oligoflexia bacterium]|nr:peptidase M15 [Oligoflexia bacterium]
HGINNNPSSQQLANMKAVAQGMEKIRKLLGNNAIKITSWLRVPKLNQMIGGSKTSAHCDGYAIDFTCSNFGSIYDICNKISSSDLKYDQLIFEYGNSGWVHISFDPKMRRQDLTILNSSKIYKLGILTREQYEQV